MTSPPTFPTFGERLQWWIEHRGLNQKSVAEAVGMAQSTLNELTKGKSTEPRAGHFLRLARELGLRPEYLLWGEGPAEATSFNQLTGLEAQLVMLFRGLDDDARRDAMLIDLNHAYNSGARGGKASAADPFKGAIPPKPKKSIKPASKKERADH